MNFFKYNDISFYCLKNLPCLKQISVCENGFMWPGHRNYTSVELQKKYMYIEVVESTIISLLSLL
jgi:hypothetical protein